VAVLTRLDFPQRVQQIIGFDISPDEADELVDDGRAEHDDVEPPPAVYLQHAAVIHGIVYPAGALIQVGDGGQLTAVEALVLARGNTALVSGSIDGGGGWATVPIGGVG